MINYVTLLTTVSCCTVPGTPQAGYCTVLQAQIYFAKVCSCSATRERHMLSAETERQNRRNLIYALITCACGYTRGIRNLRINV